MTVPNWYELLLLAAASWRTFQLLASDTILDWPRKRLLRLDRNWRKDGDAVGEKYRLSWATFLVCAYCAGFWVALAWWGFWQWQPHWTLVVAVPLAVNAGLIALAKAIGSE